MSGLIKEPEVGGFSFENCKRNEYLMTKGGFTVPKAIKTGTTIAGVIFKDGVVLGADTRATDGNIVAEKNCHKIHYIAPNIYCCGAGTAADTEYTTRMVASQLELHRLNSGRQVRVVSANRLLRQYLFRYQGHVSAALVLGGVDINGPYLGSIHPHGSSDRLPYVTMGSGSLAAMAVFEDRYKPDMSEEEAKELVADGIRAGIFNDLGSGSNVDLCVITKDRAEMIRPYHVANERGVKQGNYLYKRETTQVLKKFEKKVHYEVMSTNVKEIRPAAETMEIA
ncbi:proteasome subunit beta type-7 [Brachionus plicatilis]|uniref:Proteasome subunit beta n=1 Tax=Brachionus plicatilis TaxID=10195 RepID=A0A3M7S2L2_BRAPC|nr:proteasome subunit beta type-7 [Brachionus plicatilis]